MWPIELTAKEREMAAKTEKAKPIHPLVWVMCIGVPFIWLAAHLASKINLPTTLGALVGFVLWVVMLLLSFKKKP